MTRIAVLADIHGNLPAFEAALKQVSQQKVDLLLLAGDIINGAPDSKACWDLALSLGCPILRGNHERYAAHFGGPQASPLWTTQQFAPLQWTVAQFSDAERQTMAQLPLDLRLPEFPDLYVVHASQRDDHDSLEAYTTEATLNEMYPTAHEPFIIRAHNHGGQVHLWQHGVIVTCGSVGLPLNSQPTAQYLLIDQTRTGWKIQHQSAPYDLDAAVRRFADSGYLSATGPMGRLYCREVATAAHQIVPFLRLYAQWSKQGAITLSQALERFLAV